MPERGFCYFCWSSRVTAKCSAPNLWLGQQQFPVQHARRRRCVLAQPQPQPRLGSLCCEMRRPVGRVFCPRTTRAAVLKTNNKVKSRISQIVRVFKQKKRPPLPRLGFMGARRAIPAAKRRETESGNATWFSGCSDLILHSSISPNTRTRQRPNFHSGTSV